MKRSASMREFVNDNGLLLVGVGLMVLVYLVESLFVGFLSGGRGLAGSLIPNSLEDFAHRALVGGALLGFLVYAQFTFNKRRKAEQARARLAAIFESSNDAIIGRDLDGRITDWNKAVEEFYGYSAEELPGQHVLAVVPPECRAEEERLLAGIRHGEMLNQYETVRLTKDGRRMDVSLTTSPIKDSNGDLVGYSTVSRDITARKRAEEALRESERRLRAVISNAPVVLFAFDRDGVFVLAEGKGLEPLGLEPNELAGRSVFEVYADVPEIPENVRRALEGEEVHRTVELEGFAFDVWYSPLRDESGEVEGVIGVATEVTERVRVEEELRRNESRYRAIVEDQTEMVCRFGPDGTLTFVNKAYCDCFGGAPEELIGHNFFEDIPEGDRERVEAYLSGLTPESPIGTIEHRSVVACGEVRWLQWDDRAFFDGDGRVIGYQSTGRDVTARRRAGEELRRIKNNLDAAQRIARLGSWEYDVRTDEMWWSEELYGLFGFDPREPPGTLDFFAAFVHPEDRRRVEEFSGALPEDARDSIEHRIVRPDGGVRVVHSYRRVERGPDGEPVRVIGVIQDVTEQREAQAALAQSEANLAEAQRIARLGSWEYDKREDAARWSEEMYRIFGVDPEGFVPKIGTFLDLVHPDDGRKIWHAIRRALRDGQHNEVEYRILRPDGASRVVHARFEVCRDEVGKMVRMAGTVQDITERKELEEKLEYQAYYDHLTGLPNQNLFLERLRQALGRSEARGEVAVLFLDLDDFKVINNSLSHEVGDRLLVAVAERLRGCVRAEDTVARFGGDSFTFLFEGMVEPQHAIGVARRIQDELRAPFAVDGRELFVSAGMGISSNVPGHDSPEDLLRAADIAMHQCKVTGRDCYEVFQEEMNEQVRARLELEGDLRRAVEREEFRVFYQPVVRLKEGRVVGMEALVRWQHPRRGLLAPGAFISHAEETGLIVEIGEQVMREACRQGREWQERHPGWPPFTVGVNLSARQFQHPGLVRSVARALEESGLDPKGFVLEITESVLMEDAQATVETLEALKGLGVNLAIDDFGTGYSSLSYLRCFPADVLKVDRSFVTGLERDEGNLAILAAAINLARAMNLEVVAEGVETEHELEALEELECDLAQGYYFSKPLPGEEASVLVRSLPESSRSLRRDA